MQRHHLAKIPVMKSVYGMQSKSCGEYPIKGCRATPTLNVPKNSRSSFFAGALGNLELQEVSDSGEPHMAERVHLTAPRWQRTF